MKTLTYLNSDWLQIKNHSIKYSALCTGNGNYSNNVFFHDGKYYSILYDFNAIDIYGWADMVFNIEIWETDLSLVDPSVEDVYFSLNMQDHFSCPSYEGPTGTENRYYFSNDIYLYSCLDTDGILHCIIYDLDYGNWTWYRQYTLNESGVFELSGGEDLSTDITVDNTQIKMVVFKEDSTKYLALIQEIYGGEKKLHVYTVGSGLTPIQHTSLGDTGSASYGVAIDFDHNGDGTTLNSTDIYLAWATYATDPLKIYFAKATKSGSAWSIVDTIVIDTTIDFYNLGMTDFFALWIGSSFIITAMLYNYSTDYTFGWLIKVNSDLSYTQHTFPLQGNSYYYEEEAYLFRIQLTHKGNTIYPLQNIGYTDGDYYNETQFAIPCSLNGEEITWGSELDLDKPLTGGYWGASNVPDAPNTEIECMPKHINTGKFFAVAVHYRFGDEV